MKGSFSNDFLDQEKSQIIKSTLRLLGKTYCDGKGINHLSGVKLLSKSEIYQGVPPNTLVTVSKNELPIKTKK